MADVDAVNRTAFGVARVRAAETRRADGLFTDPYAEVLAAGIEPEPAVGADAQAQRRRLIAHVLVRTRFYDELVLAAASRQVVLVGAGLDARAWRLDWPAGTTVWELDQPAVLAHKSGRLAPPPVDRRAVAVDLRDDWPTALAGAGHDRAVPTTWLVEGVLAYLDHADASSLLAGVTDRSAPGSVLGCERASSNVRVPGTVSELWRGGVGGGADAALSGLGWEVSVSGAGDLATRWGRPELATGASYVRAVRLP